MEKGDPTSFCNMCAFWFITRDWKVKREPRKTDTPYTESDE